MKPIHPIIRLNLAQMFVDEYGMGGREAVKAAGALLGHLRDRRMDVVVGDWMEGEKGGFRWEDIPSLAAELDEMHPWRSVELG